MKEIQIFHDALNDIPSLAAQIKAGKHQIIGHLCSYTPEEIIDAAGFHSMRLFSSKSDIFLAENHLQAYCCSPVRGVLEDSLSGRLDFLDGTVFPHTCDSIQRLSDIWRMKQKYTFFADIVLPVKLHTESAGAYMADVLKKFRKEIETASGRTVTDDDLGRSIRKFNLIRKNLSEIYQIQSEKPGILKGSDLYAVVKGSMIMEKDRVLSLLPVIKDNLKKKDALEPAGKRIILSGSICDSPDIYNAVENAGGSVVGDDLCTGQRWFDCLVDENRNPMDAIAGRLINRIVCPAKHTDPAARGEHIISLAEKNRADGVIFMLLKFCDPHAFDYPYLKECLEKNGIKTMLIEIDDQQSSSGQLSTRFETFIHMV